MEIFSKDIIFGNFRASDYGLMLGSFSYGDDSEDELGITPSTIEEFIGQNPTPIYLGQKYEKKLTPMLTLVKNPCIHKNENMNFTERELRGLLRVLTGKRGYEWLKVINHEIDDDLWYKARVNNVSYQRVGGNVVGIVLEMECDSSFAWSKENVITINAKANKEFYIFNNTDDLHNYVLPEVTITFPHFNPFFMLTNNSDNGWTTEIMQVQSGEKITINSKMGIIESSDDTHSPLMNDFNIHFIRLVPDKNEYVSNMDATITFKYRVPRKVGFTE